MPLPFHIVQVPSIFLLYLYYLCLSYSEKTRITIEYWEIPAPCGIPGRLSPFWEQCPGSPESTASRCIYLVQSPSHCSCFISLRKANKRMFKFKASWFSAKKQYSVPWSKQTKHDLIAVSQQASLQDNQVCSDSGQGCIWTSSPGCRKWMKEKLAYYKIPNQIIILFTWWNTLNNTFSKEHCFYHC